ncbi:energy-coupled thiamine transporter ThiT [Ruminococcaceae bacterium R-25]|nr:energy-coupled thiamine transporter ThiT [Ruminococcaceae bacterium R-25]SUQ10718.1 energy-coupled thiamine transporter ThiT [Oscillospiraceae bacterium]
MSKQTIKSNREYILRVSTGGVCLALAFVLSQLKLFEMPMGGTVTPASTLPIIVYGVAFGPVWGFVLAFIFSLLQLIGGWLVTPFQVFLDYTLGYTALGFAGFAALKADSRSKLSGALNRFRNASLLKIIAFTYVAYFVRWLGSVASGIIFYSEYAAEAGYDSALVYSMVYNGSFLLADLAILAVVLVVLYMVIPSSKEDTTLASIQKFTAEFIGTFVLVFVGCGTAMAVGCDAENGSGYILTAFAFGLVIVAMAYCIGNVSGCHINPAVSLAMLISKKMTITDFWGYIVFQTLGAISGAGLLQYLFKAAGKVDKTGVFDKDVGEMTKWGLGANGLAGVNGSWLAGLIIEVVLTFIFVMTILGVTDAKFKHGSFGGVVIGFALVLVHILGISFTGTSVNPARSIGPAIFAGGAALADLWIFIVAPMAGAALAAVVYKAITRAKEEVK